MDSNFLSTIINFSYEIFVYIYNQFLFFFLLACLWHKISNWKLSNISIIYAAWFLSLHHMKYLIDQFSFFLSFFFLFQWTFIYTFNSIAFSAILIQSLIGIVVWEIIKNIIPICFILSNQYFLIDQNFNLVQFCCQFFQSNIILMLNAIYTFILNRH